MEILYGIKSKKKATQKFVLCKFKRSILNKELPIISKMSEPDKWGHGMLGADSKIGEKNVIVELAPPAKAGPENLKILPLIITDPSGKNRSMLASFCFGVEYSKEFIPG